MPLEPPVALFVFANPPPGHPDHLRNLTAEVERLRLHGETLSDRLGIEARFEADTTPAHLLRLLTDPELASRVVALHYAGHADPERWLLAGIDGEGASAHAAGFIELLDRLPALRLVVLNGCSTAAQARAIAVRGPAVVGTDAAIRDDVALLFADWLHRGLARGQTVHRAFDEAQAAVVTQLGEPGATRMLRPGATGPQSDPPSPWRLVTTTAEAASWRLADAIDDPLGALPQLPARPLPDSPYRHVQRFTGDYAEVFFGRGHDIRRLYERLTADDAPPVVLLYGASGVGKSSLLEAGIGPRLRVDNRWMRVHRYDPSAPLLDGLRRCLRMASGMSSELSGMPSELSGMPLESSGMPSESSGMPSDAIRWAAAEAEAGGPIVAVIDQIEEALIAADGRDDVLDALLQAVAGTFAGPSPPKGRLVLSFRKGYVAEVSDALARFGLAASRVFVKPLDRAAVIGIVTGPTRRRRLRTHFELELEPGLAERIADDVTAGQPAAVAPILQILLTRMWGRPVERPVRFDGRLYDRVRRQGVGLAEVFGRQLAEAEAEGDAGQGLLLDLLEFHTTARGTSRARDAAAVPSRYPGATRLDAVQAAIDARLLARWQGHGPEGGQGTRLAHDVWGPLVLDAFHSSERSGQRARRILENRVVDGGDAAALDAHDLGRVVEGLPAMRAPTAAEDELIARSRIEVEAAARRAKKVRWTGNILIGLLILFGFILVDKQIELEGALSDVTRARDAERKSGNAARRNAVQSRADARRAEAALARMRDATWLRMAAAQADDPSVAAAALREVSREARDAPWLASALAVLDEPIAYHWLPLGGVGTGHAAKWPGYIGSDGQDRLALWHGDGITWIEPTTGERSTIALPDGWSTTAGILPTVDREGRIVALAADEARPGTWSLQRVDGTRFGESVKCSPRVDVVRALPASDRWLFGGSCNGALWVLDQDGDLRQTAPAGADRGATRLLAVDRQRPRALACTVFRPSAPVVGLWPSRLEWIDHLGGRAERRRAGPETGGCGVLSRPWHEDRGLAAFSPGGRQVAYVVGRDLQVADAAAGGPVGWRTISHGVPQRSTFDHAPWIAAFDARWASVSQKVAGIVVVEPELQAPPRIWQTGLRFSSPARAGTRDGVSHLGPALAVTRTGRWLVEHGGGVMRLWSTRGRTAFERAQLADGLPTARYWDAVGVSGLAVDAHARRLHALLDGEMLHSVDMDLGRVVHSRLLDGVGSAVHMQTVGDGLAVVGALDDRATLHWLPEGPPGERIRIALAGPVCAAAEGVTERTLVTFAPDGAAYVWWLGGPEPVRVIGGQLDVAVADLARRDPRRSVQDGTPACRLLPPRDWPVVRREKGSGGRRSVFPPDWAAPAGPYGAHLVAQRRPGPGTKITARFASRDAWSVRVPTRVDVGGLQVSGDGRWLVGVGSTGRVYRWPLDVGSAGALLERSTVGCLPPDLRQTYFGLSALEAEEAWRRCERDRGREPLPLR